MKFLLAIALFFCVTLVSAQSVEKNKDVNEKTEVSDNVKNVEVVNAKAFVISVKGVKKIEDLDIENFNKNSFLNLISTKKRKNSIC